ITLGNSIFKSLYSFIVFTNAFSISSLETPLGIISLNKKNLILKQLRKIYLKLVKKTFWPVLNSTIIIHPNGFYICIPIFIQFKPMDQCFICKSFIFFCKEPDSCKYVVAMGFNDYLRT